MLNRMYLFLVSVIFWAVPQLAWAEGAGGSYKGIASIYYSIIAAILIYGVYDVFGTKVVRFVGPIIAIAMYFLIPDV